MPNNTSAKRPYQRLKWPSALLLTLLLCGCGLKGDLTLERDTPQGGAQESTNPENDDSAGDDGHARYIREPRHA